jgi:hypothetical protein
MNTPQPCAAATLTADAASPRARGAIVTFTAGSAGCSSAQYQFSMQEPGSSAWTVVRGYSGARTFTWNSVYARVGTWALRVEAKAAGTPDPQTFATTGFSITSASPVCTAATLDTSAPTTRRVGDTIVFTATASGCRDAQYEFRLLAPGSSGWTVAQAYSYGNGFGWKTRGAAPGVWTVAVRVKPRDAAEPFQQEATVLYTLTASCGPSVSAPVASPSPAATPRPAATASPTPGAPATASPAPRPGAGQPAAPPAC